MNTSLSEKIIQNSDEDEDSDGTLEDLTTLLAARIPNNGTKRSQKSRNSPKESSILSARLRMKNIDQDFYSFEDKPKYKYDLKSLAKSTKSYDAAEASSNRVKELLEAHDKNENQIITSDDLKLNLPKLDQSVLLESVNIKGDAKKHQVQRIRYAVEKIQSQSEKKRWYFFNPHPWLISSSNNPFPINLLPIIWKGELGNSQTRKKAFISGLVEDMVTLEKVLPDQVVLWLLKEICLEECGILRKSYQSVLTQSSAQIRRLLSPGVITDIFIHLNATPTGTNVEQKIQLTERIPGYYLDNEWSSLLSILNLFCLIADALSYSSRLHLICILLRMTLDTVIIENVDIFYNLQKTVNSLCKLTSLDRWEQLCQDICEKLFYCVEKPTLRLRIVDAISSMSVRSHDLKQKLARCFLFNDLQFAQKDFRNGMSLSNFMERLEMSDFTTNSDTDYDELRALVILMDIAVDDGGFNQHYLTGEIGEEAFNKNVDGFSLAVKNIFNGAGMPGNSFISKIQAKEEVETFSRKIILTMRTKPKSTHDWFIDRRKIQASLDGVKRAG